MKKLIEGIVEFRKTLRPSYRETFAKLALGQTPDTLFIACSDSRVVPNLFASANPGDLFVIRNVGNIVPPCGPNGLSLSDESEAAAIEFAIESLKVTDIIICGHSECGAMRALSGDRKTIQTPNLKAWLRHADPTLSKLGDKTLTERPKEAHNELSQRNVLLQLEHLRSYPLIAQGIKEGRVHLHGWWFDIAQADVYAYETSLARFVLINEKEAERLMNRLDE